MVINVNKQGLRNQLLSRLVTLTKDEIIRRSENVEKLLSSLHIFKRAKTVMVYYPLRGEVNILPMVRKVLGKKFCFPVMDLEKKDLCPFAVNDLERDFIKGPYSVMQPDETRALKVEVEEIDLVIVPGLAFDREHNRLGRGGGFYDRFLKQIPSTTSRVGVAFDFQILKSLPTELSLDEKVDLVVSEHTIV